MAQEYAFDRLARVLDNASANYLSEAQRRQRLAEQTLRADALRKEGYAREDSVRKEGYARADALRDEQRKYIEAQKALDRERELVKAGFLTKKAGTNTPEEIDAAIAEQARRALMIRGEEDADRAAEREQKAWEWDRKRYTADAGDAELAELAEKIKVLEAQSNAEPTDDELKKASSLAGLPRNTSPEGQAEHLALVKTIAEQMAQRRSVSAALRLKDATSLYGSIRRGGNVPRAKAPAPAAPAAPAALTDPNAGGEPPPPPEAPLTPMQQLKQRVAQEELGEQADKIWPQLATLFADVEVSPEELEKRISVPIRRPVRSSTGSYGMNLNSNYETTLAPTAAQRKQRLDAELAKQAEQREKAAKILATLRDYTPADADRRAEIDRWRALTNLQPTTAAAKQDNFSKVDNSFAQ